MSSLLLLFIFVPVLTGILLALNLLLAVHRPDSEKVQAYECGFSPIYGQTRSPFHVQFYLVGILFLIFDLEILLIYPLAVTLYQVSAYGFWIFLIFLFILTIGFVLEIGSGVLKFTDQKSSISGLRPENPLIKNPSPFQNSQAFDSHCVNKSITQGMGGSRLIHTKAGLTDKPTKSTSLQYFKEISELDQNQPTQNIHLLAKRHIASGAPTNASVINQFLSEFSMSITQEELDILTSINKVVFELPLDKTSDLVLDVIGRRLHKSHPDSQNNCFVGVYEFINKNTGELYVGSSVNLGDRIRNYFRPSVLVNINRPIIQSLREYGVQNFSLSIYKIDPILFNGEFKPVVFSRALEQYYIFTKNPALNVVKVAGGSPSVVLTEAARVLIGKAGSKQLYVYNLDKTVLLYISDSALSFTREVNISKNVVFTSLASGKPMLGNFVLSRELLQNVEPKLMNAGDLKELIAETKKDLRSGFTIEILDLETQLTTVYPSARVAAKEIGATLGGILYRVSHSVKTPYKGRFLIKRNSPLCATSTPLYFTEQKSTLSNLRPENDLPISPFSNNPSPSQKPLHQWSILGLFLISNIDCFGSLSLGGDISFALNFTEIQTFFFHYLLSTPFTLHIETPICLAAPLICEESSKSYFELVNEKDKGQDTDNIYILAKRHIASGAVTDASAINQCLAKFDLSIIQDELDILVSIEKVELELPLKPTELVNKTLGRDLSQSHKDSAANRFAGVYIFTNKITGEEYVGSSINLGSRVRTYFQQSVRTYENRLIIQSLNKYGVSNFTLSIYKIDPKLFETQFKPLDYSRALEQYYIFTKNSVLNAIKVSAGNPGGPMKESTKLAIGKGNSKSLYLYNPDKSVLHYIAPSIWSFQKEFQMSYTTISKYLVTGEALFGIIVFSRELIPGVLTSMMDAREIRRILDEQRILTKIKNLPQLGRPKVLTTLTDIETGKEYFFDSLVSASKFTKSIVPNNTRYIPQGTLSSLKTGDSYKGWTLRKSGDS